MRTHLRIWKTEKSSVLQKTTIAMKDERERARERQKARTMNGEL